MPQLWRSGVESQTYVTLVTRPFAVDGMCFLSERTYASKVEEITPNKITTAVSICVTAGIWFQGDGSLLQGTLLFESRTLHSSYLQPNVEPRA